MSGDDDDDDGEDVTRLDKELYHDKKNWNYNDPVL